MVFVTSGCALVLDQAVNEVVLKSFSGGDIKIALNIFAQFVFRPGLYSGARLRFALRETYVLALLVFPDR